MTDDATSGDERFDDVAARAAHELASPLNKAVAFARILREELEPRALSEEVQVTLSHLCGAADEARAVVERFHEWARAPRVELRTGVVLSSCLDRALESLAERTADVHLERADAFAPGAADTLRADADALRRVLALLLENALTYVVPGTAPRVRVVAHREERTWRLMVDDAGLGVDLAEREHVFAPFARLHGRSRYPGVGLGLSIARRMIEAHGGTLTLEDSPWGGVRACAQLPG